MAEARPEELLIAVIAGLLAGLKHVAVGAASPIPGAAALLQRRRSGGALKVSILGSEKQNAFTDGGRELFDCAGQGRIDAFFLGGVQIDGQANVNLVGIGDYPAMRARFPGCFGSAYLAFVVPKVILFREEHSPRTLVEKVDFISAPGTSPAGTYRPGGPKALLTGRGLFEFDAGRGRFRLSQVHPGHSPAEIRAETGFDFDLADPLRETEPPDGETLRLIRGPVLEEIAEVYPDFVEKLAG